MHTDEPKTNAKYTLKTMTPADLDEVVAIERASFAIPWTRDQFEREIENPISHPYVMHIEGDDGEQRLGAYVIFWLVYGEAHILDLAVSPQFRRRGVATWLFRKVIDMFKDGYVAGAFLEVRKSNAAAIRLYRNFGFKESYERKNYYGDEDALVMTLVF
ncbi:MAG: ribosomal protein S18-alanine N-acetyltransferase [Thermodesulfobacteriota bacterium]